MFDFINRILGRTETRAAGSLSDPWLSLLLGGAGPTAAGVSVGPETALRVPAVYGAVKVLSETVAQLPVHLYRRLPDGGRERVDDHPAAGLLSEPNPWTGGAEFRQAMQAALTLHGNAYAFVNRDSVGRLAEMVQVDSRAVSVDPDPVTLEPRYVLTDANGNRRDLSRADVLHVRAFGVHPHRGDSPILAGREAIGLAAVLEAHASGLFGRGARPSGLLKLGGALTEAALVRLRASFENMYRGGENAGKVAILEGGMSWEPMQLNSVDAQFLEMRKFQIAEIARLFRVPLHLLADMERTTHNNAEHMGQQFLTFCLLPILKLWQDALRITLLTSEERRDYYFEFLVDDLARADLSARFTAYSQAINAGILNPNECRGLENRGPYAGGETYMRPVNTAPAPGSKGGRADGTP